MNRTSSPLPRAFTLIELLVVVTIIVALLAILLPSLNQAVAIAQTAACASNQRQITFAMRGYAGDHFGKLMPILHNGNNYWFHLIAPYLGDESFASTASQRDERETLNVLLCPTTAARPGAQARGSATLAWNLFDCDGSYGMNLWLQPEGIYDLDGPIGTNYYNSFSMIDSPSMVPQIGDSNWVGSWPEDNGIIPGDLQAGMDPYINTPGFYMGRFVIDRHDLAINVGFVDASVRLIPLGKLWSLKWHRNFKPSVVSITQ